MSDSNQIEQAENYQPEALGLVVESRPLYVCDQCSQPLRKMTEKDLLPRGAKYAARGTWFTSAYMCDTCQTMVVVEPQDSSPKP